MNPVQPNKGASLRIGALERLSRRTSEATDCNESRSIPANAAPRFLGPLCLAKQMFRTVID
jgi:hypothetical protein